jgi:hypothetical protein
MRGGRGEERRGEERRKKLCHVYPAMGFLPPNPFSWHLSFARIFKFVSSAKVCH